MAEVEAAPKSTNVRPALEIRQIIGTSILTTMSLTGRRSQSRLDGDELDSFGELLATINYADREMRLNIPPQTHRSNRQKLLDRLQTLVTGFSMSSLEASSTM